MYFDSLSVQQNCSPEQVPASTTTSSRISYSVTSSPPALPSDKTANNNNTSNNTTTTSFLHTLTHHESRHNHHPHHSQLSKDSLFETFHPSCFRCFICDQPLAYYIYCVFQQQIYCERHYLEKIRPRCSSCSEVSTVSNHIAIITNNYDCSCEHINH